MLDWGRGGWIGEVVRWTVFQAWLCVCAVGQWTQSTPLCVYFDLETSRMYFQENTGQVTGKYGATSLREWQVLQSFPTHTLEKVHFVSTQQTRHSITLLWGNQLWEHLSIFPASSQCGIPTDSDADLNFVKENFVTVASVNSVEKGFILMPDHNYSNLAALRTKAANGRNYPVFFMLTGRSGISSLFDLHYFPGKHQITWPVCFIACCIGCHYSF